MAFSHTFSTLKIELKTHLEDDSTEYDSELSNIIARAQDRVQYDLGLKVFYSTETGTISSGSSTISRPPSAISIHFVHLTSPEKFLEPRDLSYCHAYTGTGRPRFFSDLDESTLFIAPTADADYDYDLRFMERLAALSASNPSNWISSYAADLLFHASVVESEGYLKDMAMKEQANKDYASILPAAILRTKHMANPSYSLPGKG